MAESRRGCTPAQQSIRSNNPPVFTSRFSAVAAELISRHAPCNKLLFLVPKFHFRRIPRSLRANHQNSCEKAGIHANLFHTREGHSAAALTLSIPCLSALGIGAFDRLEVTSVTIKLVCSFIKLPHC